MFLSNVGETKVKSVTVNISFSLSLPGPKGHYHLPPIIFFLICFLVSTEVMYTQHSGPAFSVLNIHRTFFVFQLFMIDNCADDWRIAMTWRRMMQIGENLDHHVKFYTTRTADPVLGVFKY